MLDVLQYTFPAMSVNYKHGRRRRDLILMVVREKMEQIQ